MKRPGSAATSAGVLVGIGLAIGLLVALIGWPAGHSPSVGEWLIQAALLIAVVVIVAARVRRKG